MSFREHDKKTFIADAARDFAARYIAPHARKWDADKWLPDDVVSKMGEAGLMGVHQNVGNLAAQLLTRRWLIHDSVGEGIDTEVIGEGVVGEQPTIIPGGVHEYQSFCILKSGEGWMEGHYGLLRQDGTSFEAAIPRFTLSASESTSLPS